VFETCAKQYEYAYVERAAGRERPSPELVFGNALHEALAFLFRVPSHERSVEVVHRALRHFWAKSERAEAFTSEDEEIIWGKRALAVLENHCSSSDLTVDPIAVERWVKAMLAGGRSVFGKVDRVDRLTHRDGLEVIDYKSGRCRLGVDELRHDLGARLYALATARTLRERVVRVRFVFLAEQTERCWDLEANELSAIERDLARLVASIEQTEVFAPSPGGHCDWCRFAELCPARSRASVDDLEAAEAAPF
jgi:RecB family exonuclease